MKAIADEGSFTGAALSLGYSQPAISQMVRRLEQRTGTVLVERVGRNVRLTEAGQVLARHAVAVLAALDAAEEEVAAIAGLRAGRVRLMAFPSSSATLVPRALALVKQRFPDVQVTFTEAEPPESLAALQGRRVRPRGGLRLRGHRPRPRRGGHRPVRHAQAAGRRGAPGRCRATTPSPTRDGGRAGRPRREELDRRLPALSRPPAAAVLQRRASPRTSSFETEDYVAVLGPRGRGPRRRAHPRPDPAHAPATTTSSRCRSTPASRRPIHVGHHRGPAAGAGGPGHPRRALRERAQPGLVQA